jgi:hypothetical protein
MEDLALSLDRQNAEDLMRPPAPATPGSQLEQLTGDKEQHAPPPFRVPDSDELSSLVDASELASNFSDLTGVSLEEADLTDLSFEDTIRKYIPDKSDLATSLKQRDTFACLVGDGIEWVTKEQSDLDEINRRLVWAEAHERPSLLVIQVSLYMRW